MVLIAYDILSHNEMHIELHFTYLFVCFIDVNSFGVCGAMICSMTDYWNL